MLFIFVKSKLNFPVFSVIWNNSDNYSDILDAQETSHIIIDV